MNKLSFDFDLVPGLSVAVLEHFQPSDIIFVHHYIADREGSEPLHSIAARPFHNVNEFATELQGVDFKVNLEQGIRHSEQSESLRS